MGVLGRRLGGYRRCIYVEFMYVHVHTVPAAR